MAGGVFCIESWSGITDRSTVRPLLEFMAQDEALRFVHRSIETKAELHHYLSRFAGLKRFGVAYLAMHGARGVVYPGSEGVALASLGEWARLDQPPSRPASGAETWKTDLARKVLYLGSCATLDRQTAHVERLRKQTGAVAICGYTRSVEWTDSAAFELLLLPALAHATGGTRTSVAAAIRGLRRRAGDLMDHLGFVSYPDFT